MATNHATGSCGACLFVSGVRIQASHKRGRVDLLKKDNHGWAGATSVFERSKDGNRHCGGGGADNSLSHYASE